MIVPSSKKEFTSFVQGHTPSVEQITEGIWVLPLVNKPGHMPYTLIYLVQDAVGAIHLIDSGWDIDENVHAVEAHLQSFGVTDGVASITITHLHPDHLGLARRLRQRYGSPVALHALEQQAQEIYAQSNHDDGYIRTQLKQWGVPFERCEEVFGYVRRTPRVLVPADRLLEDGELLPIPGRALRVMHTPGHTPGHMCLYDETQQLLFSGDQLLPRTISGLGQSINEQANPLVQYLESLEQVIQLGIEHCLPGHEYRFRGVGYRAAAIATRYLQRTVQVAQVLEQTPSATAWEVASQLTWGQGWDGLTRHYLISALRQTMMHMHFIASGAHCQAMEFWGVPAALHT